MFKRKKIEKGQLQNVDVDLISLLYGDMKPANGKGFVAKCDGINYVFKGSSVKTKSDDLGRVYVTVMEPGVVDCHGDSYTPVEIRKACDNFASKGLVLKNDINHNMQPVKECSIVESYILKTADKTHFPNTKIDSWVAVIKYHQLDGQLWADVKAGKFNGVSLYGKAEDFGDVEDAGVDKNSEMIDMMRTMINELKAKGDEKLMPAIEALEKEIAVLIESNKNDITTKQIARVEKGFNDLLASFNKAFNNRIETHDVSKSVDSEVVIEGQKIVIKNEKRDLYKALGDVDSGQSMNVLSDNLGQQFIDSVIDMVPSDVFSDISVIELSKDEELDIGLIEDIVFTNSSDADAGEQAISEVDLKCPTEVLVACLALKQETVEFYRDKKGETEFGAYIENKLSSKIKKALQQLIFIGDKDNTTGTNNNKGKYSAINGFVKLMSAGGDDHDMVNSGEITYAGLLAGCLETFDIDKLSDKSSFVMYCSPHTMLKIRSEYAQRATELGDKFIISDNKVYFQGIEIKERYMPNNVFIIGLSKFLILGYRTEPTIKIEHSGKDWKWRWFIRIRFAAKYIPGGFVKVFTFDPNSLIGH